MIEDSDGDFDRVKSACHVHCQTQAELKTFFGLKKKLLFSYSCICFSFLPSDNDMISKHKVGTQRIILELIISGNNQFDTTLLACDDYKQSVMDDLTAHQGLTEFLTVSKEELPTSYSSREGLVPNICNYERVGNVLTG